VEPQQTTEKRPLCNHAATEFLYLSGVPSTEDKLSHLPEDSKSLQAIVKALLAEREEQERHAEELRIENLRLQLELERYKKYYYGPHADRLGSSGELAQMLLEFSEALERKPVNPDDLPSHTEPEAEPRRVKRRHGHRHLANFDHLPLTTHVYELSAEQRACPGCGVERRETGAEESWQIEYLPGRFERIHHVRKKYACPGCESSGEYPQMETAAKP